VSIWVPFLEILSGSQIGKLRTEALSRIPIHSTAVSIPSEITFEEYVQFRVLSVRLN